MSLSLALTQAAQLEGLLIELRGKVELLHVVVIGGDRCIGQGEAGGPDRPRARNRAENPQRACSGPPFAPPANRLLAPTSDAVVACMRGVLKFSREAADSPMPLRMRSAARSSAASTPALFCASNLAEVSLLPDVQSLAFSVTRYPLPLLTMLPVSSTWRLARWQTYRPTSGVITASGFKPMSFSVATASRPLITSTEGDCSRSISSACFRMWSKSGSPVPLVISATVSL